MAHIAWLGKKSPFCGNVTYGLATTEALRSRGHEISFIHFDTPAGFPLKRDDAEGGLNQGILNQGLKRFRAAPAKPTSSEGAPDVALSYLVKSQVYTIPSPGAQRELRESLERLQPDLVHASLTLSPLDFRLPDLCQQLGLPLVATFHPAFDASLRNLSAGTQQLTYQLYAPSLAKYHRVVVFSELQAEVLSRLGVPEARLAVIPNGVDPNLWTPAPVATAASADLLTLRQRFAGQRVFLYMGRIATEKNVEALLRAWRLVQPTGCTLVVVGDGPVRQSLMQTYGPEIDVLWWGHEPDQAKRLALLQLAEVFLLPSLVEGLSLALLEAMASGTACVATDAGADGEVLEGGAGIVISTQGVTTQLRTLLPVLRDQPVLTAELGRRARARALERYTLERNIDQLELLYAGLVPQATLAGL
ncbi:glycosyltransferase family 4 protein [Synechococcus sp. HJ21-Hayes]|uniref:glycosyltransferase family 4 protein n=1 Tax=unclassified Synechococcus TaxID=2626047 RepID=UPI0020CD9F44|nr:MULTISPECIES: glycosyltransferase family 4 protein [unclassified Synechococcus]MCP9829905.1 glycosyltransferase family 4 protein [Synechococcus sp. JJ3a-Johnson]MCP9851566.1 glycosyltransferase family 4 protein [Synechococcus sp. HJ21-Hayes]